VSTKIHHGYRIDDDLLDERSFVAAARAIFGPVYEAEYLTLAVAIATQVQDCRALAPTKPIDVDAVTIGSAGDDVPPTNPMNALSVADRVMARTHTAIRESGRRNPSFDFACEIVLLRDLGGDGGLYALFYAERSAYRDTWAGLRSVTPWPYWNTTDRPDDVTDDEWEQRRLTWDRLLPRHDPPAIRGLSWSLIADLHTTSALAVANSDPARIDMAVPSASARLRALRAAGIEVDLGDLPHVTTTTLLAGKV
jgi:hypothetical protein